MFLVVISPLTFNTDNLQVGKTYGLWKCVETVPENLSKEAVATI